MTDRIEADIANLRRYIDNALKSLNGGTSPALEEANFELRILELERELRETKRARILFYAYIKTGQMKAQRGDGVQIEGNPVVTDNKHQNLWNVRAEAARLAEWSFK